MSSPDPREELIEHLQPMRAFAVSLCRDQTLADDLVQDAIEKAWRNIDKYKPGTNLRAWLFAILRNTYYSNRRRVKREVPDPDGLILEQVSEKPAHDGRLQLSEFVAAFATLPDEQREALILVGASGFSYEEAAETCGVAVGTIKSRANRARKRLIEILHLDDDARLDMTDAHTMAIVSQSRPTV